MEQSITPWVHRIITYYTNMEVLNYILLKQNLQEQETSGVAPFYFVSVIVIATVCICSVAIVIEIIQHIVKLFHHRHIVELYNLTHIVIRYRCVVLYILSYVLLTILYHRS